MGELKGDSFLSTALLQRSREVMHLVASVHLVQGQMPENRVLHHCYISLRSKVGVKVKVTGHGHGSRSNFRCTAVDIRGSALPRAAKSINHHYQSINGVCNQWADADNWSKIMNGH